MYYVHSWQEKVDYESYSVNCSSLYKLFAWYIYLFVASGNWSSYLGKPVDTFRLPMNKYKENNTTYLKWVYCTFWNMTSEEWHIYNCHRNTTDKKKQYNE